jgi:hypothetical protein
MDDVERIISEVEKDEEIMRVRFTDLLHKTADMLEKHGFGTAKVFLLEKQSRGSLEQQAQALVKILGIIERYPKIASDRKTARLIIKAIDSLKSRRRR